MSADFPTFEQLQAMGPVEAAAVWLERLARQEDDGHDALFLRWLKASDANQDAWDQALELWDDFDEAEDEALERMRRDARTLRPRRKSPAWLPLAIAASVALAVLGTLTLHLGRFGEPNDRPRIAQASAPDPARFGAADYVTAVGEQRTVELSDGSKLTLDANSAVDVAYAGGLRMARLVRGQAFFDVAHDAAHPFRVAASGRIISVLGTRFNVAVSEAEMRVVLVEGAIAVGKGDDPRRPGAEVGRLSAGQQLVHRAGGGDQIGPAEGGVAWKDGFVSFDRRTLASAIEELNRYSDKKLVVRDPKVAALRISGAFPTGDTQAFILTITALYPLKAVATEDGKLEIVRRR